MAKPKKDDKDKRIAELEQQIETLSGGNVDGGTVQYRETDGILKFMDAAAKADKLSRNQWARKIIRNKLGFGG
jgi:hypothetical protein